MGRQHQRFKGENGYVLVTTLLWMIAMSALLSTFVVASHLCLLIAKRYLLDTQCIAVTRGVSATIVSALRGGHHLRSSTEAVFDNVQVDVKAQEQTGEISVKVEGKLGDVADTISFTYDTIGHRLYSWQDNGPGIAE